jgi:hypothetical protein
LSDLISPLSSLQPTFDRYQPFGYIIAHLALNVPPAVENHTETEAMDNTSTGPPAAQKSHNLFQVYLRLRPPQAGAAITERFLAVEPPLTDAASTAPTHITLNPPNDRRRAVEKFAFTQVFTEDATQLDVFHCTNVVPLVEGVLAPHGGDGTDALLATLGVSGSGKVCYEYLNLRLGRWRVPCI